MATVLERLLNAHEVADLLGISTRSVFRLARLAPGDPDRLPAIRIGHRLLFHPDDVRAYIEARRG